MFSRSAVTAAAQAAGNHRGTFLSPNPLRPFVNVLAVLLARRPARSGHRSRRHAETRQDPNLQSDPEHEKDEDSDPVVHEREMQGQAEG